MKDETDLKWKKINNKLSILLQNRPPHSYISEQNEGWNWLENEEDKQCTFHPPPRPAPALLHCCTQWRMELIWKGRRWTTHFSSSSMIGCLTPTFLHRIKNETNLKRKIINNTLFILLHSFLHCCTRRKLKPNWKRRRVKTHFLYV